MPFRVESISDRGVTINAANSGIIYYVIIFLFLLGVFGIVRVRQLENGNE